MTVMELPVRFAGPGTGITGSVLMMIMAHDAPSDPRCHGPVSIGPARRPGYFGNARQLVVAAQSAQMRFEE